MSIFQEYYANPPFEDRFARDPSHALDVIIPVYHTNELWRANLLSIYREVPVRRMLISDGGCTDDSIDVARQFPRVEVLDHRHYKTLGKCIAELVRAVSSEWFIYLHSDVYLPKGWFDAMVRHQGELDWFGCPMDITVMVKYRLSRPERPYAGSQMGRKAAFMPNLDRVDDDYVYRQEDFVFQRIVEDAGFKEGQIEDTFHYHQVMYRQSAGLDLKVQSVEVVTRPNDEEAKRASVMQVLGYIKYVRPSSRWIIDDFLRHAFVAVDRGWLTPAEIDAFMGRHQSEWRRHFNSAVLNRRKLRGRLGAAKRWIVAKLG